MKLGDRLHLVVIANLDDEQCIEKNKENSNEQKIRFNQYLRTIPELYSQDNETDGEYVDGLMMKRHFMKSNHMLSFTNQQDRLVEITEPRRRQAFIDVHKHYPVDSFDLSILAIHLRHRAMSLNDWWITFKNIITISDTDENQKQIQLLCAPAFSLPLPRAMARQAECLIKFYTMFKGTVDSIDRTSADMTSLLSTTMHILPAIQLSFRPNVLHWFDERIKHHKRLKYLLNKNDLCLLVACGSEKTSFQYDFSLIEYHIINQFNSSERQLHMLVKRFAINHLNCSLPNYFLLTSILWICEIHDLENYHDIFEVWVSFMRDVCRKHFLSHYFLENINIYEEHVGLADLLNTIDYRNIDEFVKHLQEYRIHPYSYPYNERITNLIRFLQNQPVLTCKMKTIYKILVKPHFSNINNSLEEICSIICHLSFLEDNDMGRIVNFWDQQWKPLFIDFDRDDIVLVQRSAKNYRPDQLAQQMTESVLKLIELDLLEKLGGYEIDRLIVQENELIMNR